MGNSKKMSIGESDSSKLRLLLSKMALLFFSFVFPAHEGHVCMTLANWRFLLPGYTQHIPP
jgi:hypothetical protein